MVWREKRVIKKKKRANEKEEWVNLIEERLGEREKQHGCVGGDVEHRC